MIPSRGTRLERFVTTMVVALSVTAADATQTRPVNLEEMTQRATTIFAGRCSDVRVETDPAFGGDVTVATFQVQRSVKGDAGGTITARMPGSNDAAAPAGMPSFARGDDVVLFLYGESAIGLRAPVGLGQGRFRVLADKLGRPMALNDFGNRNLARGLSTGARQRLAVTPLLADEVNLSPEKLLDAVERLLAAHP